MEAEYTVASALLISVQPSCTKTKLVVVDEVIKIGKQGSGEKTERKERVGGLIPCRVLLS